MSDLSNHRIWRIRTMSGDVFWTVDLTKEQLELISQADGFVQLSVYRSLDDLSDGSLVTTLYVRQIESLFRVLPQYLKKAGDY